jgi:mono/diheme cytochrome c family protein
VTLRLVAGLLGGAVLAGGGAVLAGGCSEKPGLSPSAERGRQIYQSQCTACHHPSDPAKPGALGPEIAGTPRPVLEAKVVQGTYPPGYSPKRSSRIMQPMPALAGDVDALADYLQDGGRR